MDRELPPDDFKTLWQNQKTEPVQMSLDEIRRRAEKFQRRIRNRNAREYAAAAVVIAGFGYFIWRFPPARWGGALILAATFYVVYQLHSRGSARTAPASLALGSCLEFHRRELERQRDLIHNVWKWYLAPFVPGLLVLVGAPLVRQPENWMRALPAMIVIPVMFYAVWRVNKRGADQLQRQIDELNSSV